MQVVTTRSKGKSFAWSYSRLKNFATCPKRYFNVDVAKLVKEEESEVLVWGNKVHEALANYVGKGEPLPRGMETYQKVADRVKNAKGTIVVEQKLAITKEHAPCTFFDREAWFRCVVDALVINGPVAMAIDYKLGKILEESQQLALTAAVIFSHHPEVQKIRTEFWWLKEEAESRADFTREDLPSIWNNVLPRVQQLQAAHESMTFPAKPGGLCRRYCPVDACPHHGI